MGWISIKDSFPGHDGEYVIVCVKDFRGTGFDVMPAYYCLCSYPIDEEPRPYFEAFQNDDISEFVAYWMPMPSPPENL